MYRIVSKSTSKKVNSKQPSASQLECSDACRRFACANPPTDLQDTR